MRLTIELFAQQTMRVRRVIEHIGHNLDADLTLPQLADLACLSVSQLERLYRSKVRETPLATLRRLRLKRAVAQLRAGRHTLNEIGQLAGYASAAAFTHAFVRQFGCPPTRAIAQLPPDPSPPPLRLERLPERMVYQLGYRGARGQQRGLSNLLVGSLAVAGARRWRNWQALDRDSPLFRHADEQVDVLHFVPMAGQPDDVGIVDRVCHAGGLYAVKEVHGHPRPATLLPLAEQIRHELGCLVRDDRRILLREITVSGYTAPQERRVALYLPVAPLDRPQRRYL